MRRLMILVLCVVLAGCSMGGATNPTVTPPSTATPANQSSLNERPTVAPNNEPATAQPTAPISVPMNTWQRPLAEQSPRLEGDDVRLVQQRLLDLNYADVGEADGIYGPKTAGSVQTFQGLNSLPITGIVDQATWDALFAGTAIAFVPAEQFPTEQPVASGNRMLYLKPDGKTIASLTLPDNVEQPFTTLELTPEQAITSISADPSGRFVAVNFGEELYIYYANGDLLSTYSGLSTPIWSPDGSRFMANVLAQSGDFAMVVYNTERADEEAPLLQFPATQADWNAAGDTIITVINSENEIVTINVADGTQTSLLKLPFEGDQGWAVTSPHFAPDENYIYFYGGQTINLGASGNGMQWWVVATQGGAAGCSIKPTGCGEPQGLTEPSGNGIGEWQYTADRSKVLFSIGFHQSACLYSEGLMAGDGMLLTNRQYPFVQNDLSAETGSEIRGATWQADNTILFSQVFYTCNDTGQVFEAPRIFSWNPAQGGVVAVVAEGSYPTWLK